MSSTIGMGTLSLIVMALRALQSVQKRQVPSFFFTNNTGDEKGLVLGLIKPRFSISCTCFSISSFRKWAYLDGRTFKGLVLSLSVMQWSISCLVVALRAHKGYHCRLPTMSACLDVWFLFPLQVQLGS